MKRVRINVGNIGIVSKRGDYKRILKAGAYWLRFSENVKILDMSKMYTSYVDFDIMYKDNNFLSIVETVDVQDNEIVLKYYKDNFESVLKPGRYFYFKGLMDFKFTTIDLGKVVMTEEVDATLLQNELIRPYVRSYKVESYQEALLFVDGKFIRKMDKGTYYFWKNATPIEVMTTDLRQLQLEISGQEILTKDKAALRLNFYAQYKVINSEKALLENKDFEKQLYIMIQLALREFVGTMTLDELLENKDEIGQYVWQSMKDKTQKMGVQLLGAGIRDVILPGEMKEIMNQVLIAQKQAQANTIKRREETAATRSLLNSAKLMEDNKMLFKLKEMEYVEKIAEKIGEITVSGNGQVIDQLKNIFSSNSS